MALAQWLTALQTMFISAGTLLCQQPCITSDIKKLFNQETFRCGDRENPKHVQHELKRRLHLSMKKDYRREVESELQHNYTVSLSLYLKSHSSASAPPYYLLLYPLHT